MGMGGLGRVEQQLELWCSAEGHGCLGKDYKDWLQEVRIHWVTQGCQELERKTVPQESIFHKLTEFCD